MDYDYIYLDDSDQSGLTLFELSTHPIVIVHSEDESITECLNGSFSSNTYSILKQYLNAGGALLIEGRRNLSGVFGSDGTYGFKHFLPGDFRYDNLNINSAYIPIWVLDCG